VSNSRVILNSKFGGTEKEVVVF